ncbi:MAG TPA: hypothetical protein VFK23_07645 [Nitrospirota bacterium]|nr:hypothetical protein [Nitrospirota bacterium]
MGKNRAPYGSMNHPREFSIALVIVMVLALDLLTACDILSGKAGEKPSRTPLDVPSVLAGSKPVFVSDYFSFVGSDERGHVAFAIDNDRSRRGNKFSADAHVFLHDERTGWVTVSGNGGYENRRGELLRIPDSPDFQFIGEVKDGITLVSPRNRLTLSIDPMQERFSRATGDALFSMGSTSATLAWGDRVIPGRVIYEYLFVLNLSPWYSYLSGLFYNDFQGLYLETGDGGDFYLRSEKKTGWSRSFGNALGFQVLDRKSEVLEDLRISVPERSLAVGFYRWPRAWQASWRGSRGRGSLTVKVVDRKNVTNWFIGGFAMAIVEGELSYDGSVRPVYGLAELIR